MDFGKDVARRLWSLHADRVSRLRRRADGALPDVYLTQFPSGDGRWKVSIEGGSDARWSSDGKELFYLAGDHLMVASVATMPSLSVGTREQLFRLDDTFVAGQYDVAADEVFEEVAFGDLGRGGSRHGAES